MSTPFSILSTDADAANNKCIQGYEVYNTEICAEEMTCVDHTGQGLGHWVEEACCGGYFWAGDPVTTLYGINWSDCLYLRNATGGLTFDMTDSSDACIDFDTWFQMFDTGDYGVVQYSDDGGIHWWDLNTPYTGNSSRSIWALISMASSMIHTVLDTQPLTCSSDSSSSATQQA